MSIEYEWHFSEASSSSEPADRDGPDRPRWRRWLALALVGVLLLGAGLYVWWRLSRAALAQVEQDVAAVARLEMQALDDGDIELYMSLQDGDDPQWLERQRSLAVAGEAMPPPLPGLTASVSATVEHALVIGERARVEIVRQAGPPGGEQFPFRAVRFYRLVAEGRWMHTTSDPEYAGRTLVWVGPRNDLAGHLVESDLLDQSAPELELTADAFCGLFSCPDGIRFALAFTGTLDTPKTQLGVLPAPHLVGVPDDDAARAVWVRAAREHLVDVMFDQVVGDAGGGFIGAGLRAWVEESVGVAQPRQPDVDLVLQAAAEGNLPMLSALWEGSVSEAQRVLAENEVALMLAFIEREYGRGRVVKLLETAAQASSLDAWVQTALDSDLPTFERAWLNYLYREASISADNASTSSSVVTRDTRLTNVYRSGLCARNSSTAGPVGSSPAAPGSSA